MVRDGCSEDLRALARVNALELSDLRWRLRDPFDEVDARLHLDVHEDVGVPEASGHGVIEPASVPGRVFAPVADEHPRRGRVHPDVIGIVAACSWAMMPSTR